MMRISLAVVALLLLGVVSLAQESPSWATKRHHSSVDGNQLYSECQSAEENVRTTGDTLEFRTSGSGKELVPAGMCWGYVLGVMDSIPEGEGFDPDPGVRGSQYVDVVLAYLRNHPERRNLPAYGLIRHALADAFPSKP
jgi:hypothetical protein